MESSAAFLPQGYGVALASVALYWLLLALPGFVLLKRYLPAALEGAGLGAVALSYLASFVALSPLSIACYLLRLPLWVMSAAVVLALIAAAAGLLRGLHAFPITRLRASAIAWFAMALIAADMLLGLRSGSNFGGDGRYHAARVRSLIDLGFNNWDPLVSGARFDDVYHTNLYHALIAVSAQLTGVDPASAWAFTWFWAKLVCAASIYYLTWTVSGERWVAWISAAMFALWMASSAILAYPNMLAAYSLLPLAWAFCVELQSTSGTAPALRGGASSTRARAALIGIAASAWVLPQVHALYYVFLCMLVAPVLLFGVRAAGRRPNGRRELAAALIALSLGAPWLGVTAWHRAQPSAPVVEAAQHRGSIDSANALTFEQADQKRETARSRGFIRLPNGMLMLDPATYLTLEGQQLQLVILLAVGIAANRRRAQFATIAGLVAVVMAMLYVPPLCTAISKLAGAPWIVRRLAAIPAVLHLALLPCAALVVLPELFVLPWFRIAYLCAAIAYATVKGLDSGAWQRKAYLERAIAGKPQYDGLRGHAMRRDLFQRNVPPQATIVTALNLAGGLGVDCNCYALALSADEPSHGVRDMDQRRADVLTVLDPRAPAEQRIALLRYYGVTRLWIRGYKNFRALNKAYRPWLIKVDQYHKERVLTLDVKKAFTPRPKPSFR